MGWFDDFKSKISKITVSSAGGEWAAIAMACMVFADGEAEDQEIQAASEACSANPVITNSIGASRATALFTQTVNAIKTVPSAMLPSYESKLAELGKSVNKQEDKNFAYATVIQVAMADGELEAAEVAMLKRFKDYIGANIEVPGV